MFLSYFYDNLGNGVNNIKYSFSFMKLIYLIMTQDICAFDDVKLEELKQKIVFNGPISLKFMQWYLSKKGIENDKGQYDRILDKFEDIFDNCPFHSLDKTKSIFEADFKIPMNSVVNMDTLEELASGSIGQVYKCNLINGETVAIKVQHPSNQEITSYQFQIINFCMRLQQYEFLKNLLVLHIDIEDFMYNLLLQMDFSIEAFNTLKFEKNFEGNELVVIPKLYYYSPRVTICKFEDGQDYDDLPAYQKIKVGMNFYCSLMQMNFYDDFTHGDLHKKNWKVRKTEGMNDYQIIFYDFGIVLSTGFRDKNIELWESFQENDIERIISILPKVVVSQDKKPAKISDNSIILIRELFDSNFGTSDILNTLVNILSREKLYINRIFLNILIIMTLCEKIFIQIDFVNRYYPRTIEKRMRNITSRYGDILAFVKKYPFYSKVQGYVENKYNSYQIEGMFDNHNNKLILDDPLDLELDQSLEYDNILTLDDPLELNDSLDESNSTDEATSQLDNTVDESNSTEEATSQLDNTVDESNSKEDSEKLDN